MSVGRKGRRAVATATVLAAALGGVTGAQAVGASRAFWSSFEPAEPAPALSAQGAPRLVPAAGPPAAAALTAKPEAGFTGLQKGAVTENPVKTANGFHVIKLDDTRAAKLPTLEEVKPQIAEALTQQKLEQFKEQMVKKAKVQ